MRDAFGDAFPPEATEIRQIVANKALDTLAVVRNLIVAISR
jgi:hypothetical protein